LPLGKALGVKNARVLTVREVKYAPEQYRNPGWCEALPSRYDHPHDRQHAGEWNFGFDWGPKCYESVYSGVPMTHKPLLFVELRRFELLTSSMRTKRSTN
jgi:hypothetical protein